MSISPNVGALSSFLSRKLTSRLVTRLKKEMESFLKKTDTGEQIWSVLKRSEDSIKSLLTPGMLFEALQFEYVGPLPGHHIESLIATLKNVKSIPGPVLVHVLTKKGKGYLPSEKNPECFHGLGPFDISTGEQVKSETPLPPSFTNIFSKTLVRIAEENPSVVAITAAMLCGTGLDQFQKAFPDRFFDVGIAEQHAVTFSAGLALEGLKPVVAIYSTFLQRSYDQIIHDVCLTNLPVVFAIDRGGLVGDDGPTHHGAFDLSFLRTVPNLMVMAPRDENELQHMLYTAVRHDGPTAIRYPRGNGIGVSMDWQLKELPPGKGEILRDGNDAFILAIGPHVYTAIEVSKRLADQGVRVGVADSRFLKPLDHDLITNISAKTKNIVTLEENALMGGFGSAVLESLSDSGITDIKVKRMGLPDVFIEHGSQKILKEKLGLDVKGVVLEIKKFLNMEKGNRLRAVTV
jgi:1-deoxy-D-xylulose-5-phosphate synthase